MKLSLLLLAALVLTPLAARGGDSSDVVNETARNLEGGNGRVASFWWLPQEYWESVAKELEIPAGEQEKVRTLFRDYAFVGALEARLTVSDKKPEFATIGEIAKRATFLRNGEQIEVLRDVNPELARLAPTLVYLLRASLSGLGDGLRLLPLPNIDAKGNPILTGSSRGELKLLYRFDESATPQEVIWRAPLTAIAGAKKCPKGSEKLEANWDYCPWHGVKADAAPR
jgi:hypothetical protein